jgi:type IV secretion system protein VirB10
VLLLASGTLNRDPSRNPAHARPTLSDPARPEMAQGAVRDLPSNYTEAQAFASAAIPPQLGPPLPGDVAAFAPDTFPQDDQPSGGDWEQTSPDSAEGQIDPAEQEAEEADRSGLFFALRDQGEKSGATPVRASQLRAAGWRQAFEATPAGWPASPNAGDPALHPGAVIAASLITGINSEAPGPVIAQVTQSTYDSATGRILLIPQGARLIGNYRSTAKYGQSRVAILWSRLILVDGREIALDEAAVDPSGAAGVGGRVDNHWPEVFGAAALGTLINVGAATTEEPEYAFSGIGGGVNDPVDDAIADGIQQSASIVTNRVVDRSLALPPTIRVEAGMRISIIVTKRIAL